MLETIHPARRPGRAPRDRDRTALPAPDAGGGVRDARGRAAARPPHRRGQRGRRRARARRHEPDRRERPPLRRRGAARREAEPDPERHRARRARGARRRSPSPASRRAAGAAARASFASAPHAAHPELRRRKAHRLAAEPLARGVAQSEVWDEVRAKSARMGVHSPTGAQADVFRSTRDELRELERAFPLQPGQCGALLALGDDLCLDYVSRPEAFARLYPKLRAGYLLDALERLDGKPARRRQADRLRRRRSARRPAPGSARPASARTSASAASASSAPGLELDGELLQLCAFTGDERSGRIARPSRRR